MRTTSAGPGTTQTVASAHLQPLENKSLIHNLTTVFQMRGFLIYLCSPNHVTIENKRLPGIGSLLAICRGAEIRTRDLTDPNRALYRAEPHPVTVAYPLGRSVRIIPSPVVLTS